MVAYNTGTIISEIESMIMRGRRRSRGERMWRNGREGMGHHTDWKEGRRAYKDLRPCFKTIGEHIHYTVEPEASVGVLHREEPFEIREDVPMSQARIEIVELLRSSENELLLTDILRRTHLDLPLIIEILDELATEGLIEKSE